MSDAIPVGNETLQQLSAFFPVVYQALEEATQQVRDFFEREGRPIDLNVASSQVRWRVKDFLDERGHDVVQEHDDDGLADYDRELLSNNGLSVLFGGGFHVRILRAAQGWIPAAGDSKRRLAFYRQEHHEQFLLSIPGAPRIVARGTAREPIKVNLLLVWFTDAQYTLNGMLLVCPKDSGQTPASVQVHWTEPVPHPALAAILATPAADPAGDNDLPITHQPVEHDDAAEGGDEG